MTESGGGRPESRERLENLVERVQHNFDNHLTGLELFELGRFLIEAYKAGERDMAERTAQVLSKHWLTQIRCNHEAHTDRAFCYCCWMGDEMPTVGAAVEQWATHVSRALAGVPAEPCGIKFTGCVVGSVYTCVLPKDHAGDHDDAPNRAQWTGAPAEPSNNTELLLAWLSDVWTHRRTTVVNYGWWQTVYNEIERAYRARLRGR